MPIFIKSLFTVLPVFWLLLAASGILFRTGKKRPAQLCFYAGLFILLTASTGPAPLLFTHYLETRYAPLMTPLSVSDTAQVHVLVLGGGHTTDESLPPNNQLSLGALGRLIEGIRIQKMHPGSLLILSGFPGRDPVSNAEVMHRTAMLLGVDSAYTAIMPQPASTRLEAAYYRKKFGDRHPLIIVSTATHIPRAMIWFSKQGLSPVAAPTNHIIKIGENTITKNWWVPSHGFIELTDRVIYEVAGIVQAWLAPTTHTQNLEASGQNP